ncbi:MAG: VWA domain-containing protein [Acidobacteria bacterium]|nr:VWA domain-containing protein [Acidobacteriota bacterium]
MSQQPEVKFEVASNLVVVNVTVRDRAGKIVEGLKKEDFQLFEDDKPQKVSVFEFQQLRDESLPPPIGIASSKLGGGPAAAVEQSAGQVRYKDRRLMVLFFDLSSMKPAEEIHAQQAALKFLNEQMTVSDMVALMTFSSALELVEDFTDDREKLIEAINNLPIGEMAGLPGDEADAAGDLSEEESNVLFLADDTEFNIFNTDRRLSALEAATRHLSTLPEKKALVYFSSGVGKTGVENQSQLRATVNEAQRANVVFYTIDARGLIATPPGGDATRAAQRGTGIFSGKTQRDRPAKLNDEQDTLYSLAADTGGKALLDENDLTPGITQAQKDLASYYILGYYSTNALPDGRFRRIRVRLAARPQWKVEHRAGYYAGKVFANFNAADKERQLEEALQLGDPKTELPLALEINYFRLNRANYFVPVAVKVPAGLIALARKGPAETAELDFIGQVRDSKGKLAGAVRDTIRVKLTAATAAGWSKRALEYDTGFLLAPGAYRLRFLARENGAGKMGTFETRFEVPDLNSLPEGVRMSSVVWSNQRETLSSAVGGAAYNQKLLAVHPLVRGGQKLVPSITRVFRKDQNLYVYFEVYDPEGEGDEKTLSVAASLGLYRGRTKAFESEPVRISRLAPERNQTLAFQFQVPLAKLRPGRYNCQLNVVDEVGRKFAFPRAPLVLLP